MGPGPYEHQAPPPSPPADAFGRDTSRTDGADLWSRRQLFAAGLSAAALALAGRLTPPAGLRRLLRLSDQLGPAPSGSSPLVVLNPRPLDAEAPITALRTLEMPNENFFVRSHHGPPQSTSGWKAPTAPHSPRRPPSCAASPAR